MEPESIEKTRERFGVVAYLKRFRPVAAAVATFLALIGLPYAVLRAFGFFLGLLDYVELGLISWISDALASAFPLIAGQSFLVAIVFFYWKPAAADWVIDRSIYFYRLAIFPWNVLYFRAFRLESGLEQKLRSTERIRRRHERRVAARRHRENMKK